MTTEQHSAAPREIGPGRFQRPDGPPPTPVVWRSLASAFVLLLVVVGVPVGLVLLAGVPQLPTSLPTREQLTGTIGAEQVLSVLVWVAWLAWLQFTICVLVELRSAISGIGLPARVPLSGPSQRLARTLVASVLLLITTVGPAAAAVQPALSLESGAGPAAVQVVDGGGAGGGAVEAAPVAEVAAPETVAPEVGGTFTYHLGDMQLDAAEGAALAGRAVYVVQPPDGRHHDNLWDIAERTLGDGRRYQEIFELNKGRPQADGRHLELARLIQPNWLLVMPDDAVGVDRVVAVQTPAPDAAPPVAPVGPGSGTSAQEAGGSATVGATTEAQGGLAGGSGATGSGSQVEQGATSGVQQLVGVGLLAAGALAAVESLRRRRRTPEPSDEAVEVEVALRIGADPTRATLLDRGLRHLAGALRDEGRDLPGVFAARVDEEHLVLHLTPGDAFAPQPWRASEDGRTWVLDANAQLPATRRPAPAPFPGLVSLGRDGRGGDVLVDLEAAQGPVSVVGDPTAALEVATAFAVELATNRWSDQLRVTGVGLPAPLGALDPARYRPVGDLTEVLPELRARRSDALGGSVLAGRLRGPGAAAWMPEYLLLGSPPSGGLLEEVLDLAATQERSPLGVVCVGELPGARWRLEVDAAGSLTVGVLGVHVRANRLSERAAAGLAELLTPEPTDSAEDERWAALEAEGTAERPPVVAADPPRDAAAYAAAPVRVAVLGAPRVEAPGPIEPARLALATELVVHLALHPEGVHPTVLAASLWPGGVTPEVRTATIERVRDWLGTDTSGSPRLREGGDGRLRLGGDVVLDWDAVRSLLAASRGATGPQQEARLLGEALRLAQGPLLGTRPAGRYSWLARVRLERAARGLLVDAAHRLGVLCRRDGDPEAARQAAWSGLRVAPTEELLWRDLLRATAATGTPGAVEQVAADLELTLHDAGLTVASATVALLDELLPGAAATGSGG